MKEETLINEISETVERLWDDAPPHLVLQGWWWKRYIPFFRRQQRVVNEMFYQQWENGGRETHERMMEREARKDMAKIMNKHF